MIFAGVPELPRGIKIDLVNDNKDLLIQWEVPKSELRPVNSFLVIVNKLDTRRQSNEEIYETQQTNFTLMDINLNTKYVIQICAKNTLGDSCSDEVTFSSFIPPITQGLPRNEEESGLDVPGFVLILLALPVLVSLLCCFMMLIVFWVCCRPSESRKYYPREEGMTLYSAHYVEFTMSYGLPSSEHRHKEEYVLSLQGIYMVITMILDWLCKCCMAACPSLAPRLMKAGGGGGGGIMPGNKDILINMIEVITMSSYRYLHEQPLSKCNRYRLQLKNTVSQ